MNKIVLYGLTGSLLFAVSATVSLYMQQQGRMKGDAETATAGKGSSKDKAKETSRKSEGSESKAEPPDDLRPVVRPGAVPTSDEAVRLANSLRDRLKAVRDREEQVNSRQKQMEMIYQDIRGERGVLDDLRKQLGEELKALTDKMANVEKRYSDLETQRQSVSKTLAEVQKKQTDFDGSERKNLDKMASMYDSMAPESAARILQQMADGGKIDTAVKLLSQMKERQAAKVLAELPDVTLAAQLLDKMRGLKRPTVAAQPASLAPASAPATDILPK